MAKSAASVEFRHVTKRYGAVTAVQDVSFTIEPGTLRRVPTESVAPFKAIGANIPR